MTGRPSHRFVRLALALVLPATALTACGDSASGQSGTISIWAHESQDNESKVLQDIVDSFNRSQSKVKATLRLIPQTDYYNILQDTPASKMPDVVEFDGPQMANLVYNHKLTPIDGYLSIPTIANATDAATTQGTMGGKLYSLSMYDSGLGIYGDKRMLDRAGVKYPKVPTDDWTAAQFTTALKTLAATSPGGKALDIQENSGLATSWGVYAFSPIVWSAGGQLIQDGNASGVLDTPKVAGAFRTFQSWKPYVDANADGNAFASRRVALSWAGHWKYPAFSKALGSDLVVLPLPDFGAGPKTGQGSYTWGIGADTKNGKAAGAFLDYLLNDKNVTEMTQADGAPPATRSVLASSPLYGTSGPLHLFAEQLDRPCGDRLITSSCIAVTRPVTAGFPVISTQFGTVLNSIFAGADPRTALTKAANAINQDFANNNGYAP
jgi:multiple sugar transport system substrate-binding protein